MSNVNFKRAAGKFYVKSSPPFTVTPLLLGSLDLFGSLFGKFGCPGSTPCIGKLIAVLLGMLVPVGNDCRCNEDGGVGAGNQAEEHHQREIADGTPDGVRGELEVNPVNMI